MFRCYSLNLSHPLLLALCPQICFLCLHLHCCPINRFTFFFFFLFSSSDFYRAGGIMLSDFKLYHKAIVIKTVWLWQTDQWNSTESSEINLHIYQQLTYNKKDKNIQWKTASSISGDGKYGQLHVKK